VNLFLCRTALIFPNFTKSSNAGGFEALRVEEEVEEKEEEEEVKLVDCNTDCHKEPSESCDFCSIPITSFRSV